MHGKTKKLFFSTTSDHVERERHPLNNFALSKLSNSRTKVIECFKNGSNLAQNRYFLNKKVKKMSKSERLFFELFILFCPYVLYLICRGLVSSLNRAVALGKALFAFFENSWNEAFFFDTKKIDLRKKLKYAQLIRPPLVTTKPISFGLVIILPDARGGGGMHRAPPRPLPYKHKIDLRKKLNPKQLL